MTYRHDGQNWIVRLTKGERLLDGLKELVEKEPVASAWISGIGGAAWAELGFYDLPKQRYEWKKMEEPLEILSVQGNIAFDEAGKPIFHLHGTFGRSDFTAIGGHIKDLEVAGTCEIFVSHWSGDKISRHLDEQVGLPLLDL